MGGKKKADPYEVFYHVYLFAVVIGLGFFAFLKLNDQYLRLMGRLYGCYSVGFMGAVLLMGGRLLSMLYRQQWKFTLRTWLFITAAVLALICGISCAAKDMSGSKTIDVLTLVEQTEDTKGLNVLLSERAEKVTEGDMKYDRVYIDVYRTSGRIAKKIGSIEETYFDNRCVATDSYTYTYSDDGILTLTLYYGHYGNGIFMLDPSADTGELTYTFKIN